MKLTESEIRSIVKSELLRSLDEGTGSASNLIRTIEEAMLEAAREIIVRATRDVRLSQALRTTSKDDPGRLADRMVTELLHDSDFRVDLISLFVAAIKRTR